MATRRHRPMCLLRPMTTMSWPTIIHRPSSPRRPANLRQMSVEEAVMELDLTQADVVMFRHAGHGGLNVVYRRADGNIGWIDPALAGQLGSSRAPRRNAIRIIMELADILAEESVVVATDASTRTTFCTRLAASRRGADRLCRGADFRRAQRARSAGLDRAGQRHRRAAWQVRAAQARGGGVPEAHARRSTSRRSMTSRSIS